MMMLRFVFRRATFPWSSAAGEGAETLQWSSETVHRKLRSLQGAGTRTHHSTVYARDGFRSLCKSSVFLRDPHLSPLTSRLWAVPMLSTSWSSSRRSRRACCYGDVASRSAPCRRSPAAPAGGTPSVWRSRSRCRLTSWLCWPGTWQVTMTTAVKSDRWLAHHRWILK